LFLVTPIVIYTGSSLQAQWFPDDIPDWKFNHSPDGWSNNGIAMRWLREVYLPEITPENKREWRLSIIDQHSTYVSVNFMYED
jgi:hypothetical protein